jgi:hypothetical protein
MTSEVLMKLSQQRADLIATPLLVLLMLVFASAPRCAADPTSTLTQAGSSARAASSCPALEWNSQVQRAAQLANQSTSDYISFRSGAVPFTDPMPALRTIGYPDIDAKGMVLSGYGATEADALKALILQYQALRPDCTYTQAGVNAFRDQGGFNLASAVLIAPAKP